MNKAALASMTALEQFHLMRNDGMWIKFSKALRQDLYWLDALAGVAWAPGYFTEAELLTALEGALLIHPTLRWGEEEEEPTSSIPSSLTLGGEAEEEELPPSKQEGATPVEEEPPWRQKKRRTE